MRFQVSRHGGKQLVDGSVPMSLLLLECDLRLFGHVPTTHRSKYGFHILSDMLAAESRSLILLHEVLLSF